MHECHVRPCGAGDLLSASGVVRMASVEQAADVIEALPPTMRILGPSGPPLQVLLCSLPVS